MGMGRENELVSLSLFLNANVLYKEDPWCSRNSVECAPWSLSWSVWMQKCMLFEWAPADNFICKEHRQEQ